MATEFVNPEAAWDGRSRGYSHAVRVNAVRDLIFVAGQAGLDENLNIVPGGIKEQTRKTFENIQKILDSAGSSLDDIVKMTVFLTDIENHQWPVREVRNEFFDTERLPVSTMVEISRYTIEGLLIEVDVVAAVSGGA